MFGEISIWTAAAFVAIGLFALAWSSDRFVLGAAALARILGISPFVIGMVIVGFGTSAPELLVSAFSGISGHTDLSLGNAYGSCVFNIAAILGVAALIRPLEVKKSVLTLASPLLLALVALAYFLLRDGKLARADAIALLVVFALVMPIYCRLEKNPGSDDSPADDDEGKSISSAVFLTVFSLAVMVAASHMLVAGSVSIAKFFGVGDLLIGLTIVAIGTSLPELASAIAASRRNESALVLGNIIGSNIFNMLAVVGIAGSISPSDSFSPFVVLRDLPALAIVTALIPVLALMGKKRAASGERFISRAQAAIFITAFSIYVSLTLIQEVFD